MEVPRNSCGYRTPYADILYSARCSSDLSLLAIKLEKLLAKDLPQVYTVFRSWKLMRGGTHQKCTTVCTVSTTEYIHEFEPCSPNGGRCHRHPLKKLSYKSTVPVQSFENEKNLRRKRG